MPRPLTSDVLHGDGDGGGEFPRHPEGFVTQLLVHQRTFKKKKKAKKQKGLAFGKTWKKPLGGSDTRVPDGAHLLRWLSSAASGQNTGRRWRRP